MKILISGICGFVGSALAKILKEYDSSFQIYGFDNFLRQGSESNRLALQRMGVFVFQADLRCPSDFETFPEAEWVIDAAANPSVLAGIGMSSSRQLLEHNLIGTMNMLEYCRARKSGFILLSTSRVYSILPLLKIPLQVHEGAFRPAPEGALPEGVSFRGISENFANSPPLSLYGTSKRASELLALEFAYAFDFPIWINRCGILAGAGQFGRPDQGIINYWINAWRSGRDLSYVGRGYQVRDCLHPLDLAQIIIKQLNAGRGEEGIPKIVNLSGGHESAISLRQLSEWCSDRFGKREVPSLNQERTFDIPWLILDSQLAAEKWGFVVTMPRESVLEEIALHAESHPDWLEQSGG